MAVCYTTNSTKEYTGWEGGAMLTISLLGAIFYALSICNGGGGHIASPMSVPPYVRTSCRSCPVHTKNGFLAISFEYIGIGFIFHTQVYNHKIQVKFDYG